MINRLNLTHFKAFESVDIDFKPLSIFLGPNNSGKSSILAPFRIISQTLQSYDNNVPILLNGVMGDFGTYKDIVFSNNKKRYLTIDFEVQNLLKSLDENGADKYTPPLRLILKFKFRSAIREIILKELKIYYKGKEKIFTQYSEDSERHVIQRVDGIDFPLHYRASSSKYFTLSHFLPRGNFLSKSFSEALDSSDVLSSLFVLPRICNSCYNVFSNLEYVGAMRVPPARTYMFSGERNKKVGSSGENAVNLIAMDSGRRGSKSKNILKKVVSWLKKSGIASDIKILPLSDRHYEFHIQNSVTKEYQNFADVGYGNSQVIPVLVGGYNLERGSVFLVEEPEIHLHPRAQAELGDFFLELHNQGIQSLVETHSEYLVVRLQQHVAAGLLNPKDVGFYYVYANKNKKEIVELKLDRKGQFLEKWPEGFFPERLEEAKKLAKLRSEFGL